jgi:hypothetical protein
MAGGLGSGALGNNRYTAAISDQIAIIMNAAIEDVARRRDEDVDTGENDMAYLVYNKRMGSQGRSLNRLWVESTHLRRTAPSGSGFVSHHLHTVLSAWHTAETGRNRRSHTEFAHPLGPKRHSKIPYYLDFLP